MCYTSFMNAQCVAVNNVVYVASLLVLLSPLHCVFFCEESISVHLTWPVTELHFVLMLSCDYHVVHDQHKGKRFRNKFMLYNSASYIFSHLFWNGLYVLVWAVFLFWFWEQFFIISIDVLHFLATWKFVLSFDRLSGNEEGKLLARMTMAVLRLAWMIVYLKSKGLYWVFRVSV